MNPQVFSCAQPHSIKQIALKVALKLSSKVSSSLCFLRVAPINIAAANVANAVYVAITKHKWIALFMLISPMLSGCSAVVNMVNYASGGTSIYLTQSLIMDQGENKDDKIAIEFIDATGTGMNVKEDLKDALDAKGYTMVNKVSDANTIVYITVKNLVFVDDRMKDRIKKYLQYQQVTYGARVRSGAIEHSTNNFEITDDGVSFGSNNVPQPQPENFATKVASYDFVSGAAIGAAIGFGVGTAAPVLGVPWGVTIGALLGGTTSVILQQVTSNKNYMAMVELRVAKKAAEKFELKRKVLTSQGSNMLKEAYVPYTDSWVDYETSMLILDEYQLFKKDAIKDIEKAVVSVVSNMVY